MSQVDIEKIQSEAVTPELAASLQKIGFVAFAGLSGRSLIERSQLFNPFDDAHTEAAREAYIQFAENNGLYVAVAEHLRKREAVGFALVHKPVSYEGVVSGGILSAAHIEQWAVLPCVTINPAAISNRLIAAIQDDIGIEQPMSATVLEEQPLAMHALRAYGFVSEVQEPEIVYDYFGKGTAPVTKHTLHLPGSHHNTVKPITVL